ncbi:MAG: rRNA adenine N-6-methyltransferase family protein [Mycobacteriales bacterium]
MDGRRRWPPNPPGAHFLAGREAAELVRRAGVRPGDLVVDLGAGYGAVTAPLLVAGARVLAVERDPDRVARLRRRFAGAPGLRVVQADLRAVQLPRTPYRVVANVPFALVPDVCRRLLDPQAGWPDGADLLVGWGRAKGLATSHPAGAAATWWAARFTLTLARRVPAASFRPPPSTDAAHLVVRPRPLAGSAPGQRLLRALLRAAYRDRWLPALEVFAPVTGRTRARRLLGAVDADPRLPARALAAGQWHDLVLAAVAQTSRRSEAQRDSS